MTDMAEEEMYLYLHTPQLFCGMCGKQGLTQQVVRYDPSSNKEWGDRTSMCVMCVKIKPHGGPLTMEDFLDCGYLGKNGHKFLYKNHKTRQAARRRHLREGYFELPAGQSPCFRCSKPADKNGVTCREHRLKEVMSPVSEQSPHSRAGRIVRL